MFIVSREFGKRAGKNVGWLYLRLAAETATEIVVARMLLSALGVDGYGLFAAAAGSIGAFGFFQGSLEAAARRFVCCDCKNFAPLLGLALVLAGLLGLIGGLVSFAVLPYAAAVSLSILVVLIVRLIRIPFEACIVAGERMGFFLIVSLAESVLAFVTAALVERLSFQPVTAYAVLRLASSVFAGVLVIFYCLRRHPTSRTHPQFRLAEIKEILGFFGWQALGSVAGLLKGNGIVILLAVYVGSAGCAAYEVSGKFAVLLWGLITNYRMAYLPGIVKAWSAGDREAFVFMTHRAFGWSLLGMTMVVTPIVMFASEICCACFGEPVPDGAPMFLRAVALQFFFEALATPYDTAILASGRIALYEIVLTALLSTSFFLAWAFLASGLPAWTATGAVAVVNVFAFLYRFVHLRLVRLPDGTRAWFVRCAS